MDIEKLKAEFEKLKYINEKLEYLNFDEHLGCYVEKNNGMPVGLAAWVNGAFYGFEQAAKAQAVPEGFVLVNKKDLVKVLNCVTDDWLVDTDSFEEFKKIESLVQDEVNAMIEAQEPTND